ncbi:unnamed protein product, partial [Linum tenue]
CRYTSFPGLFPLLSRGTPPLVTVEEISQTIDSENFTVQNSVRFASPYATTSISTNANFEVRSPKRVQVDSLLPSLFSNRYIYARSCLGLSGEYGFNKCACFAWCCFRSSSKKASLEHPS